MRQQANGVYFSDLTIGKELNLQNHRSLNIKTAIIRREGGLWLIKNFQR